MTRPDMLPSALCTASAPRIGLFRGSMAGLCVPLSTLRRSPHEQLRMTRGRCGSLLLHRKGLAPSTPCRSPGASHITSAIPLRADIAAAYLHFACEPEHDIKPTLLIADASDAVLRLAYLDRSKTSVETVGWP